MIPTVVLYEVRKGREEDLRRILRQKWKAFRKHSLVGSRRIIVSFSKVPITKENRRTTFVEYFEWKSNKAIARAHKTEDVRKIWNAMDDVTRYRKRWDGIHIRDGRLIEVRA